MGSAIARGAVLVNPETHVQRSYPRLRRHAIQLHVRRETLEDAAGKSLLEVSRLGTMVTVVDAKNFLADWQSEGDMRARKVALGDDDERSIADLLAEQIEWASGLFVSGPLAELEPTARNIAEARAAGERLHSAA